LDFSLALLIGFVVGLFTGPVFFFFLLTQFTRRLNTQSKRPAKRSASESTFERGLLTQGKKQKRGSRAEAKNAAAVMNASVDFQKIKTSEIEIPVIAADVLVYEPGELGSSYPERTRLYYSPEALSDPEYLQTVLRSPLVVGSHEKSTTEFNRDVDGWPLSAEWDEREQRVKVRGVLHGEENVAYAEANKGKPSFGTSAYISFLEIDRTPGTSPDGKPYDAVVRKAVNNHIAILPNIRDPKNVILAMNAVSVDNAKGDVRRWQEAKKAFIDALVRAGKSESDMYTPAGRSTPELKKLHDEFMQIHKSMASLISLHGATNADDPEQLHRWIKELSAAHPEWEQDQVVAVAYKKIGENATMATNVGNPSYVKPKFNLGQKVKHKSSGATGKLSYIGTYDGPENGYLVKVDWDNNAFPREHYTNESALVKNATMATNDANTRARFDRADEAYHEELKKLGIRGTISQLGEERKGTPGSRLRKLYDEVVAAARADGGHSGYNSEEESKNSNEEDNEKMDAGTFKEMYNAMMNEEKAEGELVEKVANAVLAKMNAKNEDGEKKPEEKNAKNEDKPEEKKEEPVKDEDKKEEDSEASNALPSEAMVKDFADALGVTFKKTPSFKELATLSGVTAENPAALIAALNAKRETFGTTAKNGAEERSGAASVAEVLRTL